LCCVGLAGLVLCRFVLCRFVLFRVVLGVGVGMSGLIVPPGEGRKLVTRAQEVTFKVTGADGARFSCFEVMVPPGFDVGAHMHHHAHEFFYVLEGELDLLAFEPQKRTGENWHEWRSAAGDRVVRAGMGACMFVPPGTPHAFRNATTAPARMLFHSSPAPDHERYFEEIADIWATGRTVDSDAVENMRARYDVTQITPLRYQPPTPPPGTADTQPGTTDAADTGPGTAGAAGAAGAAAGAVDAGPGAAGAAAGAVGGAAGAVGGAAGAVGVSGVVSGGRGVQR
jgi:mannose-6-phosphate isomerase-like protein (cupin superfamily)